MSTAHGKQIRNSIFMKCGFIHDLMVINSDEDGSDKNAFEGNSQSRIAHLMNINHIAIGFGFNAKYRKRINKLSRDLLNFIMKLFAVALFCRRLQVAVRRFSRAYDFNGYGK